MKYDILCVTLMLLAFVGGFQKGIIRTFAFFLALVLAAVVSLLSSPYVLSFLESSMNPIAEYVPIVILFITFLICFLLFKTVLRILWIAPSKEESGWLPRTAGGLLLASIMLLSISVITNFLENSSLIGNKTRDESRLYGFIEPINERTEDTWVHLRSAFQEVRKAGKS